MSHLCLPCLPPKLPLVLVSMFSISLVSPRIKFCNQTSYSHFFLWLLIGSSLPGSLASNLPRPMAKHFLLKSRSLWSKRFPVTTTQWSQRIWGTAQNNSSGPSHTRTHISVNWPWFSALLLNFILLCLFPQISWLRWKWKQAKGCRDMDEYQLKHEQNYPNCNHNVPNLNLARSLTDKML